MNLKTNQNNNFTMIIWLASYPKSGNTLIRSILATYFFSNDGVFSFDHLYKIGQFPSLDLFSKAGIDISKKSEIFKNYIQAQKQLNNQNGKKLNFLKTHSCFFNGQNSNFSNLENTLGAIYVVRDPRNVLTSIQNHYEFDKDEALKFMLDEKKFIHDLHVQNDYSNFQFISSWEKHYQSWTQQQNFPIKIIKYEDLNNKTYKTFKEIVQFVDNIINSTKKFDA